MSRARYSRFGLGVAPEVTWKPKEPSPPPKLPRTVRTVLNRLQQWHAEGRPYLNSRELAAACGLSYVDAKRAIDWLDDAGLVNDRREPTR